MEFLFHFQVYICPCVCMSMCYVHMCVHTDGTFTCVLNVLELSVGHSQTDMWSCACPPPHLLPSLLPVLLPFPQLPNVFFFPQSIHAFLAGCAILEPLFFNSCSMTERKSRNSDKQTLDKWHFITPTWISHLKIILVVVFKCYPI